MKTTYIASLAFALMTASGAALAEKVVVIVNAKNAQSLTAADVKNIYNDNVVTWESGARITVYEPPLASEARETFSQKVLGTSARDAAAEWSNKKITNSAKNPPTAKPDSVVVNKVARDPDAIGYVRADAATGKEGIRIIMTVE
jgi:ABC-type phosphate transport system substrate-binding protein